MKESDIGMPYAPVLQRTGRRRIRTFLSVTLPPYVFIFPTLLFTICLVIWPLALTGKISLQKWIISLGKPPHYIGLRNYADILQDPWFWNAFKNTVFYVLGTVPASIVIGFLLAILLNLKLPARSLFRGIFFFPTITSTMVMAITWKFMFSGSIGVIPYFLSKMGLPFADWLSDPKLALPAIILFSIWHNAGFVMVIFLAALQSVPESLIEAAQMDRANKYQILLNIIFPLMAPATLFATVISVINGFKVFDQVYVMTGGGPGYSTTTLVQYIYEKGFQFYDMGSASAASVILFLSLAIFTVLQIRLQKDA